MRARRSGSPSGGPGAADDEQPSTAARALSRVIERGSRLQRPAVQAYVERLRNSTPGTTPAEVVARLEKHYLRAVTGSGAAVGAAAAVPALGTLVAMSVLATETAVFLEATALFVLAVAEVHGIPAEQRERRRALVLAVLVGDGGKRAVADLLGPGRTRGAWMSEGAATLPVPAVSQLNSRLMRYFVKRYTLKRALLAFGKMLPVGIGAMVGAWGNRLMGKKIITNAGKAFGPAPVRWPVTLHLLPAAKDVG